MHAEEDKKKLPSEEEENQENQKEKAPEIQSKVVDFFLKFPAKRVLWILLSGDMKCLFSDSCTLSFSKASMF